MSKTATLNCRVREFLQAPYPAICAALTSSGGCRQCRYGAGGREKCGTRNFDLRRLLRLPGASSPRGDARGVHGRISLAPQAGAALCEYPVAALAVGGGVGTEAVLGDGSDDRRTRGFGVLQVSVEIVYVDEG